MAKGARGEDFAPSGRPPMPYGRLEKTQDYKIRLGRECTRPNGGRQEHAAKDIPIGKGPGLRGVNG